MSLVNAQPEFAKYGGSHQNLIQSILAVSVATVFPADPFDVNSDVKNLNKAFEEDKKVVNAGIIIRILTRRTSAQRQQIIVAYQGLFKKDLNKEIQSRLKKQFRNAILVLLTPIDILLVDTVRKAAMRCCQSQIDYQAIIHILCTASKDEMKKLDLVHRKVYGKPMWGVLKHYLKGKFKKLIQMMVQATREDEGKFVDKTRITAGANAIYRQGAIPIDAEYFIRIMTQRSFNHIRNLCDEFEKLANQSLLRVVETKLSGNIRDGLLCIMKCAYDRPAYFAEELHKLLMVKRMRHTPFIRIIVSRSEVDGKTIADAYEKKFHCPIAEDVSRILKDDYRDLILALMGE